MLASVRGRMAPFALGLLCAGLALGVGVYVQRPAAIDPGAAPVELTLPLARPAPQTHRNDAVVPPFAYSMAGRGNAADGSALIFLTREHNIYTLQAGGVIDELWRIDAIEADALRVTFLPLGVQQRIAYAAMPPQTAALNAGSAPKLVNGVATREIVVSAKDKRQLQELLANPPPGVRIRIDDEKAAAPGSVPVRTMPQAAVMPPPGALLRADGSPAQN